jgi:hypothetical protein
LEVLSVSIVAQPNTGMYEGFTDSNGDRRRRSIVLALVKVRVDGGGFTFTWTCNPAEERCNKECFYTKTKIDI